MVAYFEREPEPCTSPPSHGFVVVTAAVISVATAVGNMVRTEVVACADAQACAAAVTGSVRARPNVERAISVVVIVRPPSEISVGLVVRTGSVRSCKANTFGPPRSREFHAIRDISAGR